MPKSTKSSKYLNHGSHRRDGGTVSTASIAWVVANLLALSQPGTVNAFMPSQKVQATQTKRVKRKVQPRFPSSLNHRNIENQPNQKGLLLESNQTSIGMKTVAFGQVNDLNTSTETDRQIIIDNYLESINRRYKRVHQTESDNDRSQKGFTSAWSWLGADGSSLNEVAKRRNENDALYVLGLANHASVRLLQKHNLPITHSQQLCDEMNSNIINVSGKNDKKTIQSIKGVLAAISFPRFVTQSQQLRDDKNSNILDVSGKNDKKTIQSIKGVLAAISFPRFVIGMKRAYNYRSVVLSLQLRALFYGALRQSGLAFTRFLTALSFMSRYLTGDKLAPVIAIAAAWVTIVSRPVKA